jgi:hypothetical protein
MFSQEHRYVFFRNQICFFRNSGMFFQEHRYVFLGNQICFFRNTDMFFFFENWVYFFMFSLYIAERSDLIIRSDLFKTYLCFK